MFQINENLNGVENPFGEIIPDGQYKCIISLADQKPSKAGNMMAVLTFEVVEGEFKGRKINKYLNINHPEPKTKNIANHELKTICDAIGKNNPYPRNGDEMKFIPMFCDISSEKSTNNGKEYTNNIIKGYKNINSTIETKPAKTWEQKSDDIPF